MNQHITLAHSVMDVNGLKCSVHAPVAPKGEGTHRLPPRCLVQAYKVDEFPACPANWMHGSSKASSYFFPIDVGKHMWLDFNMNSSHTHHVAIVMSIQGINPITGQPSKILRLEKYKDKCPVHDVDFKQDRFCEKCGFKWPAQNYMTTTSCPFGKFWIDGFFAQGKVRGFLITEEEKRGVAAQIIGEDRVWAVGVAFYLSKEPKPRPAYERYEKTLGGHFGFADYSALESTGGGMAKSMSFGGTLGDSGQTRSMSAPVRSRGVIRAASASVDVRRAEIAAGAEIDQELSYPDPEDLDFYQDEPVGVIYGNYCFPDDFQKIVEGGTNDMTAGGKGFMKDLNIGNPA
jgi:hypothetical protein